MELLAKRGRLRAELADLEMQLIEVVERCKRESVEESVALESAKQRRLETFTREGKSWPHDPATYLLCQPERLSDAGFCFRPSIGPDTVVCENCNLILDSWDPLDDPFKIHSALAPSCPAVISLELQPPNSEAPDAAEETAAVELCELEDAIDDRVENWSEIEQREREAREAARLLLLQDEAPIGIISTPVQSTDDAFTTLSLGEEIEIVKSRAATEEPGRNDVCADPDDDPGFSAFLASHRAHRCSMQLRNVDEDFDFHIFVNSVRSRSGSVHGDGGSVASDRSTRDSRDEFNFQHQLSGEAETSDLKEWAARRRLSKLLLLRELTERDERSRETVAVSASSQNDNPTIVSTFVEPAPCPSDALGVIKLIQPPTRFILAKPRQENIGQEVDTEPESETETSSSGTVSPISEEDGRSHGGFDEELSRDHDFDISREINDVIFVSEDWTERHHDHRGTHGESYRHREVHEDSLHNLVSPSAQPSATGAMRQTLADDADFEQWCRAKKRSQ